MNYKKNGSCSAPAAPNHSVEVLGTIKRKRRELLSPRLHILDPNTIPILKNILDIYTDEQLKAPLKKLLEAWQDINEKGTIVTKLQLLMALWGEYKDGHIALQFQEAVVLSTRPHPHTVTKCDTPLALSIVTHNDV
jgi:hypothetical protein